MQLASVVFRNFLLSQRCARAYVVPYPSASRITLNLNRPIKVKPGQLVYVWIPAVSFRSLFQSHPFMVSWREANIEKKTETAIEKKPETAIKQKIETDIEKKTEIDIEKKTSSIVLLAQVHTGFTKRIHEQATSTEPYLAWIDGPYGSPPNYRKHESVIFVGSGIGVAAHILAIKDLLEDYKERGTRIKSIWLYWQIDQECKLPVTTCERHC